MNNKTPNRVTITGVIALLVTLLSTAPAAALQISGSVEGQARWAGLTTDTGESSRDFHGTTGLSLRGTEAWNTGIPGALTLTLETTPEPPVYRDQTQDRLRLAYLRSAGVSATLNPLPKLSLGAEFTKRFMDEAQGSALVPFTETNYRLSLNFARPYQPVWYGEMRSSRVEDTLGGGNRNYDTSSKRAGVAFNSAMMGYTVDLQDYDYVDHTAVSPRQQSRSLNATWRWNPTTASNINLSFTSFGEDDNGLFDASQTLAASGSVVIWPLVQLRSSYQQAQATQPSDRSVMSQAGVGIDVDTPWKIRFSGDQRREVRWSQYLGEPEPFGVWELRAQTGIGQLTATVRRRWDVSELDPSASGRSETEGVVLEWPIGKFGSASVAVDSVQGDYASTPVEPGLHLYPAVNFERQVAKGLSAGVNARAGLSLDGNASQEASGSLYARGNLGNGYLLDLSYNGQGTSSQYGTWTSSTGLFTALQHVSGPRSTQTVSYRRTDISADWDPAPGDDEQTGRTEEFQLGVGAPVARRTTWVLDWRWNRTADSVNPLARRYWWSVGTGLRWEF